MKIVEEVVNMIDSTIIILFLFIHWIADFVFQSHEQSMKKSSSNVYLLLHTSVYAAIITIFTYGVQLSGLFGAQYWFTPLIFGGIQFVTHTGVDYVTSRINKKLWNDKQVHSFFVMIGFDQFIHYVILFTSLAILFY